MEPRRWSRVATRLALAALFAPAIAIGQDKSQLLLPVPGSMPAMGGATGRAQPGVSTASPLGFGPSWGDAFIGASYQTETRFTDEDDGSASLGFGLGNAKSMVGVEVVVTSLSTVRNGFGDRIGSSLKVHRMLPGNAAIGVGVEGIMLNGDTDSEQTYYVALSKYARIGSGRYFNAVTFGGGVGNGRFQSEDDLAAGKDGWNAFGSVGLRMMSNLGAIADWTGQDLNLGLSIAIPVQKLNVSITPALADVTESAGDGARFTIGFGASWRY